MIQNQIQSGIFVGASVFDSAPPPPLYHPTVVAWSLQVVANGGAIPSANTLSALSTFCYGLDSASLTSSMKAVNCFVPDNLTAALTPLIHNYGNSLWVNHGYVDADLTVNGIIGNGTSKYLDTGLKPSVAFPSVTTGGLTVYVTTPQNGSNTDLGGGVGNAFFQLIVSAYAASLYFDCWTSTDGRLTTGNSNYTGFLCANLIGPAYRVYEARSNLAFFLKASKNNVPTGLPSACTSNLFFDTSSDGGAPTNNYCARRKSFAAIHDGLTSAQAQDFYNLVQAMRSSLGGGFV
jgi:hypothetical protein